MDDSVSTTKTGKTPPSEIPAANSFTDADKVGYLLKLTGKSFLYPGAWKRRFCILNGTRLYFYENENSKGTEKSSGVINLEYYDICEEGSGKDGKKAPNVFVINILDKGFFDSGKYLFSAETLSEMNDWVRCIQKILMKNKPKQNNVVNKKEMVAITITTPSDETCCKNSKDSMIKSGSFDVPITTRLFSTTKHRVRGPKGRRLPQRKSFMPKSKLKTRDEGPSPCLIHGLRTNSLSALESKSNTSVSGKHEYWLNDSLEMGDDRSSDMMAYRYSSSEESLVHESLKGSVVDQNVYNLRSGGNSKSVCADLTKKAVDGSGSYQHQSPCQFVKEPQRKPCPCELPWCCDGKCATCGEAIVDLSQVNCQDRKKVNAMIRYINLRMSELLNSVAAVRGDMSSAQRDVGALQGNVGMLQEGTGNATERLDRMTTQIVHLECQLVSLLKEVESTFKTVDSLINEAEKAKTQHIVLKHECEELLVHLRETETLIADTDKLLSEEDNAR